LNGAGRPRVVALGGGHGLATTLAAVQRYAAEVTAVVSVADDGGSSGRLREVWSGPAPGDIRRCLLSMAERGEGTPSAKAWARALDYRFTKGELTGHSLGNLVLVALAETTGDFVAAVEEMGRLLGVHASVFPATLEPVTLMAEFEGRAGPGEASQVVSGQARIAHWRGRLRRVWLEPAAPPAPPEVLEAISGADQVIIGPGSLFTSILATCAIPDIRAALAGRAGGRVYVCNLRPQDAETLGFDADAHLAALAAHGVEVDTVVCDPATAVGAPLPLASEAAPKLLTAALAKPNGHSHDPARLAEVLSALAGA
jgi:uncharacterized cofD-like protein